MAARYSRDSDFSSLEPIHSVNSTCRIAAVGTARIAPDDAEQTAADQQRDDDRDGADADLPRMIFGTSTWFSSCCCSTKKITTNSTFLHDTVDATAIAGIAARIGPTTGIISPTAEISAST